MGSKGYFFIAAVLLSSQFSTQIGSAVEPITVRPRNSSSGSQPKRSLRRKSKSNRVFEVVKPHIEPLESEMVLIPEGPFYCGSNWADPMCGPRHERNIPAFYMDVHEVTNAHWDRFVEAHGIAPPQYWLKEDRPDDFDDLPVLNISWYEAKAYAKWSGKRLPTEFEWEKAARGKAGLIFPWGHLYHEDHGNTFLSKQGGPVAVGSLSKGVSPYGCHDMLGNALEWTSSKFSLYPGTRFLPQKIVPNLRILRGVSWKYEPRPLFSRYPAPAHWKRWNQDKRRIKASRLTKRMGVIGFRCAKDAASEI